MRRTICEEPQSEELILQYKKLLECAMKESHININRDMANFKTENIFQNILILEAPMMRRKVEYMNKQKINKVTKGIGSVTTANGV